MLPASSPEPDGTAGSETEVLLVQGLAVIRGERPVIRALDLAVAPGEVVLLRGPNGAGKSTLLRLLAGLLNAAAGTVTWAGEAIADDHERHGRRLRYVGHGDAVKPALSVAGNLQFWARFEGLSVARADAALDALDLGALGRLPAAILSAGQRRRLGLARLALAPRPLWLLDEPTASLDHQAATRLGRLIDDHCRSGGMAVIASHDDFMAGARVLALGGSP